MERLKGGAFSIITMGLIILMSLLKIYLRYKTIFCNKVAIDAECNLELFCKVRNL